MAERDIEQMEREWNRITTVERKSGWTPEKRLLQSRIVQRRLRSQPWTPEQNEARSRALRGKPKTPEMRAKMYASRVSGSSERTPEWERLYVERLSKLRDEARWKATAEHARALNLEPEDVKFAVDLAFTSTTD